MAISETNRPGIDWVLARIRCAAEPDARLFADAVASACQRAVSMRRAGHAGKYERLVEAGAWTDAALALVELELPQWKPRRIACDDGQWHIRLSAQPWLPDGLDDVVETCHDALPLAILAAVVEARR
jgi:hypothetical protein